MARMSLLPGYRFHPTDVELVMYYLKRKVLGKRLHVNAVAEVNIYMFSPWDLPDKSALKSKDMEWFFFCPREKKYASGARVKRATDNGYWKTTGKDRPVSYKGKDVGIVKTLVFHLGHAPNGERTDWVMHEYRILDEQAVTAGVQDNYVLCKVFQKSGPGTKNGAQYGAPYNEEDWVDSDDDNAQEDPTPLRSDGVYFLLHHFLLEMEVLLELLSVYPGSTSGFPLIEKGPSPALDPSTSAIPGNEIDDEFARLLALLESGSSFLSDDNAINLDHGNHEQTNINGDGIIGDLADLDGWDPLIGNALDFSGVPMNSSLIGAQQECDYSLDYMLPEDDSFIELDDLQVPLDEPAGFAGTDHFTADDFFELDDFLQKANDLCAEDSFARADQYAPSVSQHPMLSEAYNQADNYLLNVLHMVDDREFVGARNPDISISESIQDIERGTVKRILMWSRSIPAAEHLIDAMYPCLLLFGDSSIHIKAEVTHRDGECTNDALPSMMEGSCSFFCWKISYLLPSCYQLNILLFWRFSYGCFCIIFINGRDTNLELCCLLHLLHPTFYLCD